jgi:L-erythrulose 1-phosphate isomerase
MWSTKQDANSTMQAVFGTNWKMRNVDQSEARNYLIRLAAGLGELLAGGLRVFVLPPVTLLSAMSEVAKEKSLWLGAQNFHWEEEGEFTGELSTDLLKDAGATVLLVGHAERRALFNESDEVINRKLLRALQEGFHAVLCIGETDQSTSEPQLKEDLSGQLASALRGVNQLHLDRLVVAYEPHWAIGRRFAAAPVARIKQAAAAIRAALKTIVGGEDSVRLIYGGNVNQGNCQAIASVTGIDGLFVGRAAADPAGFISIIRRALGQAAN